MVDIYNSFQHNYFQKILLSKVCLIFMPILKHQGETQISHYSLKIECRDWGCGSEVEYLPSMHEALSSILSTTLKNNIK